MTLEPAELEMAVRVIERGGLLAFPTDTVYGLGCDAFQDQAIERLYLAKGRPRELAIPVLLGDVGEVNRVARPLTDEFWALAEAFWPGALTLVVERSPDLPAVIGPGSTVGIRIPDLPLAMTLLAACGPLAVTSANRSGSPEARTASDVVAQLGGAIDLVLDGGETPGGRPSTVLDLTSEPPRILRDGPISAEQLGPFIRL